MALHGVPTVESLTSTIQTANNRDRGKAVDELIYLLKPRHRAGHLDDLEDAGYHKIFQVLFSVVLKDRPLLFKKSRSQSVADPAVARLEKCANAVRLTVWRGVAKIGSKTLLAIIDHITQVLSGPNGELVTALVPNYTKALSELLSQPSHTEFLARKTGDLWRSCVDCLLQIVAHFSVDPAESERGTPAPAPSRLGSNRSAESSSIPLRTQKTEPDNEGPLHTALVGLVHLTQGANAPILSRSQDIIDSVLAVLKSRSRRSLQMLCLSAANAIFTSTHLDNQPQALQLARDILPLLGLCWEPDRMSQDESMSSMRNEVSKSILCMHLHFEHLVLNLSDAAVHDDLKDLADRLWREYAKRGAAFRLQLTDVTFDCSSLPHNFFRVALFGLRPHNIAAEGSWALLHNLARIESILQRFAQKQPANAEVEDGRYPQKRRRKISRMTRISQELQSDGSGRRRMALQLVPFMVDCQIPTPAELSKMLSDLANLAADKDATTASWALVACASCATLSNNDESCADSWKQLWHLAVKLISLPATSRTACLLMRAVIDADFLPSHTIMEDINNIVTTADVNGPASLSDTSLTLMASLFRLRNIRLPAASQATCSHMIRWTFMRWSPGDSTYSSFHSAYAPPLCIANLVRACCGVAPVAIQGSHAVSGGRLLEAYRVQLETLFFSEYLLLLERPSKSATFAGQDSNPSYEHALTGADAAHLYSSKKLVLELLQPKLQDMHEICVSWSRKSSEGGVQISSDRFSSVMSSAVTGALIEPLVNGLNTSQSNSVESLLIKVAEEGLAAAKESVEPAVFTEALLRLLRPYVPDLSFSGFEKLMADYAVLTLVLGSLCKGLEHRRDIHGSSGSIDMMDIDDEFESQTSRTSLTPAPQSVPRSNVLMALSNRSFYLETLTLLQMLQAMHNSTRDLRTVSQLFVNRLNSISDDDVLYCHDIISQLVRSDLVISTEGAASIVEKVGGLLALSSYRSCEVALTTCIEVLDGLSNLWAQDEDSDLSRLMGDLYHHIAKPCLRSNLLSPKAQTALARLLLRLMGVDASIGTRQGLDSCRTILFYILSNGAMSVKHAISEDIPAVFDLFVLMIHDEVFVDVLDSLPTDPDHTSGIAFRLVMLSKLACRWPTLLRRCTYHIFEIPGKISTSVPYARRCLRNISDALQLGSPRELFRLFCRQLLYTWLEAESIEDIPFPIFGFSDMPELLSTAQAEVIGLLVMRQQQEALAFVAGVLKTTAVDLVKQNFSSCLAYSMSLVESSSSSGSAQAEALVRETLGPKKFQEATYINFVDIIATLFDLVDQEDDIEKMFAKQPDLAYAADAFKTIKNIAHSSAKLPPNQQPLFRAKFLVHKLVRVCQNTEFHFQDLWTPALVMSVARKLFNTVHPALGSLHACSVIRRARLLVSIAGPSMQQSFCVEMLLNSLRSFVVDSECADDALGLTQYLLSEGREYLGHNPSFMAGFALSTLASLRVFLESSQSSTTQESQFKATMSKTQTFHQWFAKYLSNYSSPLLKKGHQMESFKSITETAAQIRSSGNAEKSTPESQLLLEILKDKNSETPLLNEPSRRLALGLLCSEFAVPEHASDDIIESDEQAIVYATAVWKSCETQKLSEQYLSWAGRVLGRAFAASGKIPEGILRESTVASRQGKIEGINGSEMHLLALLQDLVSDPQSATAGLAEAALRTIVSEAIHGEDEPLMVACQQSLSESLFLSSQWSAFGPPPSETPHSSPDVSEATIWSNDLTSPDWLPRLSVHLALSVPDSILLSALPPILRSVEGFAAKAFPYLVHLVLCFQLEQQQLLKQSFSGALKQWLQIKSKDAEKHCKLLVNTILYLRTQEYPKESSIADRLHWLEVDYPAAATCAANCGMYKTALLFAELSTTQTSRATRKSLGTQAANVHETLLAVFENIDDPDAYYGLPEEATLSQVLSRVEYENEGTKSLAFRGALFDSHVRQRNAASEADGHALVNALSTLGLSGLSHSLMQAHQGVGATPSSMRNMYSTARRLEIWNLPAPTDDNPTIAVYKAYQSFQQATGLASVRAALSDGRSSAMQGLSDARLNATEMRHRLSSLAALTELEDVLNVRDTGELNLLWEQFLSRSEWMRSGLYEDVGQVLSCRETTTSMFSQHHSLMKNANLTLVDSRVLQIRTLILASGLYRHHRATQESLNTVTSLTGLTAKCEELGIHVEAAVNVEAANSLWDHGEMAVAIKMLQAVDDRSSLEKQAIPVARSDLLSKIGQKMSVARLEKPQDIQKKYLEPALKELKGNAVGKEAGLVLHQFATFCDNQLQDPDGLEDLARLQSLRQGKSDEVAELKQLISSTRDTQTKNRYSHVLSKEKQWLELDEQELRRVEQTRAEFVRLSLENYLLALAASDEHDNDALRFTALWFERSDEENTNKAVSRHVTQVPTRKLANLMSQLTSRLQNVESQFQKILLDLVFSICVDHPYHGMYQIWSGTKAKAQQKDDVAVQRVKAHERVAQRLAGTRAVADLWVSIDKGSKYYHALAMDRNSSKYKSGMKLQLKDSTAAHNLASFVTRYRIPPPTMHIELSGTKDYSGVPIISKLEPTMTIASGVSAPKIITAIGSDGVRYKQLVKGGHDDLRQDAIMEQVFAAVSSLLKLHRSTQQRKLGIRTYKVLPLTASSGLIEFVPNTIPLHEFLMPAHERYHPKDLKGSQCRKEIFHVQSRSVETRVSAYRRVTERFQPVMKYFFMEYFVDPDEWFEKRLAYTRSTAAISMLGHVLGLGDRHGHNILLDHKTGEAVHIDLGVAFEAGRILPVPELVPFRLTRDIVDGMGITKTEGVFRRCCEFTLDALREEQYSIMTILDVLRYDPLYTWSISPVRLAKLQKARNNDDDGVEETEQSEAATKKARKGGGHTNEPSEADRALEVVRKKLSKTLSVTATVNDLINQATDERNLAVLYSGWAAYA